MISILIAIVIFGYLIITKIGRYRQEHKLHEFTCVECNHTIVVNPNLPRAYKPNICVQCWIQKQLAP